MPGYFIFKANFQSNQVKIPSFLLSMISGFQGTIPGFQDTIPGFQISRAFLHKLKKPEWHLKTRNSTLNPEIMPKNSGDLLRVSLKN